ncbi:MAG: ROK family protein [Rhodothermales bacterium]
MVSDYLLGGVEAGGTKFICAVGRGPDDLVSLESFPTSTPEETLGRTAAFFRKHRRHLAAVGIGSFGPVDPNPSSDTYGYITSTPKAGWPNTNFAGFLQRELEVPVAFDTDVNAAALGEHRWGAARGLTTFVYLTIGTGIGGGGLVERRRMRGLVHPEMGHIRLPRAAGDDFEGACPFHGDCLEGMASGPAILKRTGHLAERLPEEDPAWAYEVHYLAHALANITCILSPERMILGGGVMHQKHLFPRVRRELVSILAGYIRSPEILERSTSYVVPPELGDRAGVLGALALAEEASGRSSSTSPQE